MNNESRFCLFCGKKIISKYRNIRKFCSRSCSVSYNDKLKKHRTDSEKIKISKSLRKTLLKNKNYITLEDAVNKGLILNPNDLKFDNEKVISLNKTKEIKCKNCGKYFKPFLHLILCPCLSLKNRKVNILHFVNDIILMSQTRLCPTRQLTPTVLFFPENKITAQPL